GSISSEIGGKLSIKPLPDGPLLVKGNLTIVSGTGRIAWRGSDTALCRCGASKNKPFCDGSHKKAGFKS
ncbi:MAG: CDGSH iron-sulfur domain-containing protein, partial [Pseudomonadota bacterium]|nr:CDGSH iron-sulfur domain-containing protein [Pseudomonadota bacterium]